MERITVTQDFTYMHKGYLRVDYKAGDVVDVDDSEMIEVAIDQHWAFKAEKPVKTKAHKSAPENKSAS